MKRKLLTAGLGAGIASIALAGTASAQEAEATGATQVVLDNIFIFFCAVLVLLMQAGFAMVEAGMTRAKNSANIMMKNLMDASVGILIFGAIGYSIAYPGDFNGWIGFAGFGISDFGDMSAVEGLIPSVDFLFQAAFAAAAATIVSGALAGRTQFKGYLLYSLIITGLIYPVVVSWQWGGGWLLEMGFVDFAGSGVVHMVGGVAAFMGAKIMGPRIGKYAPDGTPRVMSGHSLPLAILGVMLLFVGWFGFNPGSQLAADLAVPVIATLTALAAASGAFSAMLVSWAVMKKPDVGMAGNGMLAGLVAICSPIGEVGALAAIVIGAVAGAIVVFSVLTVERMGVDDPVGAVSVHGVCGFWGLIATGIFASSSGSIASYGVDGLVAGNAGLLVDQIVGGLAIVAFVAVTSGVLFGVLKAAGLLRVSEEEELAGLDVSEHGAPGYGPEMLNLTTRSAPVPVG